MSRVLCAGCTGLIGSHLLGDLVAAGHAPVVLSRDPDRARGDLASRVDVAAIAWQGWDGEHLAQDPGDLDAVINLCGAGIADQRWNAERKRVLRTSRTGPTAALAGLVVERGIPLLVQASAVGWYGPRGEPVTEDAPVGDGFLAELTRDWEAASAPAQDAARVVRLRIAAVVSHRGGPRAKMLPPLGPLAWLGTGHQPFPWVHADDVAGMILAALDDQRWQGAVNAVAPEPTSLRGFIHALGRVERRWVLPVGVPGPVLRLAIGELADMLLTGATVVPQRAQELAYAWRHPRLEDALAACRDAPKEGD